MKSHLAPSFQVSAGNTDLRCEPGVATPVRHELRHETSSRIAGLPFEEIRELLWCGNEHGAVTSEHSCLPGLLPGSGR